MNGLLSYDTWHSAGSTVTWSIDGVLVLFPLPHPNHLTTLVLPSQFLYTLYFFLFFPLHLLLKLLIGPNNLGAFSAHPIQSILLHYYGETETQSREGTFPIA